MHAAQILDEPMIGGFCCVALQRLKQDHTTFVKLFNPDTDWPSWISCGAFYGKVTNEENQLARTIALLLMYEMGEP